MVTAGWQWDPSLYEGTAAYYAQGRVAYPPTLVEALVREGALGGDGSLLDVGCGPGSLTLLLAPYFESAVGVDADASMLKAAASRARDLAISNAVWRNLRAEELPADLGHQRMVTFAQSFHWLQPETVTRSVRSMLDNSGTCVHVHATTDKGVDGGGGALPHARPPRAAITQLVTDYLGPGRRAGRSTIADASTSSELGSVQLAGFHEAFRRAGFTGPRSVDVPNGRVVVRTDEDVVASVFSLSSAAPHLFGSRFEEFEQDLRRLLAARHPTACSVNACATSA